MNISVANSHYIMAQQKKKISIQLLSITSSEKENDVPEERRDLHYSAAKA